MRNIFLVLALVSISMSYAATINFTASEINTNWTSLGNPRDGSTGTWSVSGSENVSPDSGAKISNIVMGDGIFSGTFRTTGSDDDMIGFIFGYQDMDNHYRFGWDSYDYNGGYADLGGTNGMRVIKEVAGTNYFLAQNSTRWQRNVYYNFSVTRSSSNFNVKIVRQSDAAVLMDYTGTDSQFSIGNVGIYTASQSPVYFSNISMNVPEPATFLMMFGTFLSILFYKRRF
ncbi:MAG: hypothetical protein HUU50_15810 [Candidatus Brocadiae bacterium]|nr:hypothetical protein [Candidatus Brocadiia bacterium]